MKSRRFEYMEVDRNVAGEEADMRVSAKDTGEESHRVRGRIVVDKRTVKHTPFRLSP